MVGVLRPIVERFRVLDLTKPSRTNPLSLRLFDESMPWTHLSENDNRIHWGKRIHRFTEIIMAC
jgi:hypothetical protein